MNFKSYIIPAHAGEVNVKIFVLNIIILLFYGQMIKKLIIKGRRKKRCEFYSFIR